MPLKLTSNNVAIKREIKEAQSAGGIFIPEQAQEKSPEAVVVAVGPKVENILPGQTVVVAPYSGMECDVDGDKVVIVDAFDILAVKE